MDVKTARHVLKLPPGADAAAIEKAKRERLQALHPDKNDTRHAGIFAEMTRDVLEAAEVLAAAAAEAEGAGGLPPRRQARLPPVPPALDFRRRAAAALLVGAALLLVPSLLYVLFRVLQAQLAAQ